MKHPSSPPNPRLLEISKQFELLHDPEIQAIFENIYNFDLDRMRRILYLVKRNRYGNDKDDDNKKGFIQSTAEMPEDIRVVNKE
jgi:hypothetical protein